ncbi:2TM domain-containing protein [Taklimakanibacter lacteus]|uniref:2TM domain-containing protein n=1 Tax=Taklimakanibacter lacteus TaxID=2268456 RepID=UPI000E66026D
MNQSAERKLTTILSADAVGYSRLMGQDEGGTFATLKAYRELTAERIAQHRGRVVNTAGDSILAEFPSVVRAVECAVETQRLIAERNAALSPDRQMWFRIGVNLGDVMVDGHDLFGDGVNVAARLQAMADPGGILISGTVFDHVKDKLSVSFDSLGAQAVKNMATQVPVYRVVLAHGGEVAQPSVPDPLPAAIAAPGEASGARLHRFYINSVIAGALIVLVFAINMFSGGPHWFQWPALVILLLHALRSIFLFRAPKAPATQALTPEAQKEARLLRFYANSATALTLIAFLFGINMFTEGEYWFQWPTLAILFIYALRSISLFSKRIG